MKGLEKGQKVNLMYNGKERLFEVKLVNADGTYRLFNKYVLSFNADLNFIKSNLV